MLKGLETAQVRESRHETAGAANADRYMDHPTVSPR